MQKSISLILKITSPDKSAMTPTDIWLVVRTNEFLKKAKALYDDYKVYMLVKEFEVFVDDISNWYIRTNRRRFWKTGDEKDKMTLIGCFITLLILQLLLCHLLFRL